MHQDDLAALLVGASAEEVDRLHRLLLEWSVGPESSYPVQLALLTRAQWRLAASVPRSLNDSRKWIEQHLAEYRRQTAALVQGFSATAKEQSNELKDAVASHAESTRQATSAIHSQFKEAEAVTSEIRERLKSAAAEWQRAKNELAEERQRFAKVCQELDDRLAWRSVLWLVVGWLGAVGLGLALGLSLTR